MPALFFWVLKSLPIEYEESAVMLYFGGATHLEFIIAGFIFPLAAVILGWAALRRGEDKTLSLIVFTFALLELIGALIAAFTGVAL
jgi:hypothetical protein